MERDEPISGCACFAATELPVLADLRRETRLRVVAEGARVWVTWEGDGDPIRERILALPGSEVFERRDGLWFRRGCRLPCFGLPVERDEGVSLSRALVPDVLSLTDEPEQRPRPLALCLVAEERFRETAAVRCSLRALAAWAETATSAQLGRMRAAYAGDEVLLLGQSPPCFRAGRRYWGVGVLTPLGLRPEPALGEAALREALGIARGDLLVLESDGYEIVPGAALSPVTRAGVRLAREQEARAE